MLPLNHIRTTSSNAPPVICLVKEIGNKMKEGSPICPSAFPTSILILKGRKTLESEPDAAVVVTGRGDS